VYLTSGDSNMKKFLLLGLATCIFAGCSSTQNAKVAPSPTVTEQAASTAPATEMVASPSPAETTTPSAQTPSTKMMAMATLEIQDFAFIPGTIKVKPGQTVKVTNRDTVKHNVHANDNSFKTELLGKDESATFVAPMKPGTYNYVCDPHARMMKGILIVE
jgi:plastocyanin